MAKESEVRLQVPVPQWVADEIASRAADMERTTVWLATKLLTFAVEERKSTIDWLGAAIIGEAYGTVKRLLTGKRRKQSGAEPDARLQLNVSPELAKEVEELAGRLHQTPVRMAGLLIEAALHHHEMFMDFLGMKSVQNTVKRFRRGKADKSEKLKPLT